MLTQTIHVLCVATAGLGWSVGWSTATACLTSLLIPNLSHILLISTGKHTASLSIEYILINMNVVWHLFLCFDRFVQYKATSLEKQHKHELLTEPDLGVTIDLINPDTYRIDPSSESHVVTFHILQWFAKSFVFFCTKYLMVRYFWKYNHSEFDTSSTF